MSCSAALRTSSLASAAEPGAAPAAVGESRPVAAATSAAPRASAARDRRRVVVRVDCTVGLRLRAPGPGKGPHSMRVGTDGREVLSTSSGGRAGQLLCIATIGHSGITRAPFVTSVRNGERRPSKCAPGAHSSERNAPRAHTPPAEMAGGRGSVPAQPARGSCACRLVTASRSRRIAASSSAVHGSQQSHPPSR